MSEYADLRRRLPSSSERWQSEEFAAELSEWVGGEVGPVRSLEQVKLRVWASVWVAETDDRRFYAKQNCELQAFEAALVATLAELVPDRVVPVAAADPTRGLLLTTDQGRVLGEVTADDDLDVWERVLVAGAELQRELEPHVGRLRRPRPDDPGTRGRADVRRAAARRGVVLGGDGRDGPQRR